MRPYPGPEPRTLISEGGMQGTWSPDGRQIYYTQGPKLMAVDVTPGDEFQASRARLLMKPWLMSNIAVSSYGVAPDGSFVTGVHLLTDNDSFLKANGATELHVIINWFEKLKERVPN